jgi:hypothetical protein
MRSAHKCTLALAAGFAVATCAALAQTAAPKSTFEIRKLPAAAPTGPPAFSMMERDSTPTAPLSQAEHVAITADMAKKLGVTFLPGDAPFRISLSLLHPQAGFYARMCYARSYMNGATWVSMTKPSTTPGVVDWNNASVVTVTHEAKAGYAYVSYFELRNFAGCTQGPIPFKVLICHYNPTNFTYTPMSSTVVHYPNPNNYLVVPYMASYNGHIGIVIQPMGGPSNVKGVNSVWIYPHKVQ